MRIAVDIDDVLLPTGKGLVEFHNRQYGTNHRFEEASDFEFGKLWGVSADEAHRRCEEYHATPDFWELHPAEGAAPTLQSLADEHQFFLVTSRRAHHHLHTANWVETHFPRVFSDLIFSDHQYFSNNSKTKAEICHDMKMEMLIDDNPHYLYQSEELGIIPVVFDQPWNREGHSFQRIRSWKEFPDTLNSLR